jgi:uncharacterized protein (DUF697 family)
MSDETVMRRLVRRLRSARGGAGQRASGAALHRDPVVTDTHPTVDEEAEHVVRRYALRCGAVGAIASVPGAAVAALPASVVSTLALHLRMILEIARLYGHRPDTHDFETDALAIMAGDATKEALKQASVEWSNQFAWRSLQRAMAARAIRRAHPALPGGVVVVGVPRPLARLVPLAGAPVGFGIDYAYARAVGNRAIAYYRLQTRDA